MCGVGFGPQGSTGDVAELNYGAERCEMRHGITLTPAAILACCSCPRIHCPKFLQAAILNQGTFGVLLSTS
eukprot:1148293-Pelagomonas_calceolata.AAC.1